MQQRETETITIKAHLVCDGQPSGGCLGPHLAHHCGRQVGARDPRKAVGGERGAHAAVAAAQLQDGVAGFDVWRHHVPELAIVLQFG